MYWPIAPVFVDCDKMVQGGLPEESDTDLLTNPPVMVTCGGHTAGLTTDVTLHGILWCWGCTGSLVFFRIAPWHSPIDKTLFTD